MIECPHWLPISLAATCRQQRIARRLAAATLPNVAGGPGWDFTGADALRVVE